MKRFKFISNIKYPNVNIKPGQEWTRKYGMSTLNNPFVIKIQTAMDRLGTRFEVGSKRGELYFDRSDIVNNYNLRPVGHVLSINETIAEIRGWKISVNENGDGFYTNRKGVIKGLPGYDSIPKKAELLLKDLEPFKPRIDVKMGYYELTLTTSQDAEAYFKERTREKVIAQAYLSIFG